MRIRHCILSLSLILTTLYTSAADLSPGVYDEKDANITFKHSIGSDDYRGEEDEEKVGKLYKNSRSYSNNPDGEFSFTVAKSTSVKVFGQLSFVRVTDCTFMIDCDPVMLQT